MFIIVNLDNTTGEGKRVGGGGGRVRVGGQTLCDKISLTIILFERTILKEQYY